MSTESLIYSQELQTDSNLDTILGSMDKQIQYVEQYFSQVNDEELSSWRHEYKDKKIPSFKK